MTPRSTARVQLTREFTFDDARLRVDYFAEIGRASCRERV